MKFAVDNNYLVENSVLYCLLKDTLLSLVKSEINGGKPSKGMKFSPLVIKWCVDLSEKCHKSGYDAIRKIIPLPHFKTVQAYKNSTFSTKPIDKDNLQKMVQEINRRKCKGIGGIHWDEIIIKKGIKVNSRTNELIGFENLEISNYLYDRPITSDIDFNIESDNSQTENQNSQINDNKPIAKMILQFFWSSVSGDFSWPVASFAVNNLNTIKLTDCIWKVVQALTALKIESQYKNVHVLYGVCDGAPYSSAFCNRAGTKNFVTKNPYQCEMPIYWLSDAPHMLKKLRNHALSSNRQLRKNNKTIKFSHFKQVAERNLTKVQYKHIYLDNRTKMNVKLAAQLLSQEVKNDILVNTSYNDTEFTVN